MSHKSASLTRSLTVAQNYLIVLGKVRDSSRYLQDGKNANPFLVGAQVVEQPSEPPQQMDPEEEMTLIERIKSIKQEK